MADEASRLNGAYYGPSIPPAKQHTRHRDGCGGCCCCLFGTLWKLVVALIALVVLAFVVFLLIVQPRTFKFYVTDASLTQFDYSNLNNTLNYQLALNITGHNPNRKLGIYYDRIDVDLYYHDERVTSQYLGTWPVTGSLQPKKTSNSMKVSFKGPQLVFLDADEQAANNNDRTAGVYPLDLKFHFWIRYRLNDAITGTRKVKAYCDLMIPLSADGKSATKFESTSCRVRLH